MSQNDTVGSALCGIVLHPARHTRSPAMHTAAYAALRLDAVYRVFDVVPEELEATIGEFRARGLRQLAVSIPHKERVMEFLDSNDETALAIGAVNTVTCIDDELVGANTDWIGAVRALERETSLERKRAVVLGAGGAARAVVYGLLRGGAEVTVLNRTAARASEIQKALGAQCAGGLADLADLPHDILVNTTSVGLASDESPVPAAHLSADSVVMDAVYEPERTRLLLDAEARGARTLGGKWMLVHQAAEQLRIWSGQSAPIDVMAEAFDAAGS